jgi:hypothetical protein
MKITGTDVGSNKVRSSGILGDSIGITKDADNDHNGAGLIRGPDGKRTEPGQDMTDSLVEFELDDLLDTDSRFSAYDDNIEAGRPTGLAQGEGVSGGGAVWGDPHFLGADGEVYDIMGKAGEIYNIFSDKDVQVNALLGEYNVPGLPPGTGMKKVGFMANGQQAEMRFTGEDQNGNPELYINGKKIDGKYDLNGIHWDPSDAINPKLAITSLVDGETWKIDLSYETHGKDRYFGVNHTGTNIGRNDTKSSGLWGESVGGGDNLGNAGTYFLAGQKGGGGILRNEDGTVLDKKYLEGTKEHDAALANYIEKSLFSTNSRWSTFAR